jgi:hypothetical protein
MKVPKPRSAFAEAGSTGPFAMVARVFVVVAVVAVVAALIWGDDTLRLVTGAIGTGGVLVLAIVQTALAARIERRRRDDVG